MSEPFLLLLSEVVRLWIIDAQRDQTERRHLASFLDMPEEQITRLPAPPRYNVTARQPRHIHRNP